MSEASEEIQKLNNRLKMLEDHEADFKKFLLHIFGIKIISEEDAREVLAKHRPYGNFLVFKENIYTAIDNTRGDLLVAEFLSLEKAFTFLKTEIFVEVIQNAKKTS